MSIEWRYTQEMQPVRERSGEARFWTWFALGKVGFWLQSRGVAERLSALTFAVGLWVIRSGCSVKGSVCNAASSGYRYPLYGVRLRRKCSRGGLRVASSPAIHTDQKQ